MTLSTDFKHKDKIEKRVASGSSSKSLRRAYSANADGVRPWIVSLSANDEHEFDTLEEAQTFLGSVVSKAGVRQVRTAAGVKRYNAPIGTPIVRGKDGKLRALKPGLGGDGGGRGPASPAQRAKRNNDLREDGKVKINLTSFEDDGTTVHIKAHKRGYASATLKGDQAEAFRALSPAAQKRYAADRRRGMNHSTALRWAPNGNPLATRRRHSVDVQPTVGQKIPRRRSPQATMGVPWQTVLPKDSVKLPKGAKLRNGSGRGAKYTAVYNPKGERVGLIMLSDDGWIGENVRGGTIGDQNGYKDPQKLVDLMLKRNGLSDNEVWA